MQFLIHLVNVIILCNYMLTFLCKCVLLITYNPDNIIEHIEKITRYIQSF